MQYELQSIVKVTAEYAKGDTSSKHIATDFFLEVSDNLDANMYMNNDDVLTAAGSICVTQCFVQGLLGNIAMAHEKGYRNDAEHLRYIISELERGFVAISKVEKGLYKPIG